MTFWSAIRQDRRSIGKSDRDVCVGDPIAEGRGVERVQIAKFLIAKGL